MLVNDEISNYRKDVLLNKEMLDITKNIHQLITTDFTQVSDCGKKLCSDMFGTNNLNSCNKVRWCAICSRKQQHKDYAILKAITDKYKCDILTITISKLFNYHVDVANDYKHYLENKSKEWLDLNDFKSDFNKDRLFLNDVVKRVLNTDYFKHIARRALRKLEVSTTREGNAVKFHLHCHLMIFLKSGYRKYYLKKKEMEKIIISTMLDKFRDNASDRLSKELVKQPNVIRINKISYNIKLDSPYNKELCYYSKPVLSSYKTIVPTIEEKEIMLMFNDAILRKCRMRQFINGKVKVKSKYKANDFIKSINAIKKDYSDKRKESQKNNRVLQYCTYNDLKK